MIIVNTEHKTGDVVEVRNLVRRQQFLCMMNNTEDIEVRKEQRGNSDKISPA